MKTSAYDVVLTLDELVSVENAVARDIADEISFSDFISDNVLNQLCSFNTVAVIDPTVFQQQHFHGDKGSSLVSIAKCVSLRDAIPKQPSKLRDRGFGIGIQKVTDHPSHGSFQKLRTDRGESDSMRLPDVIPDRKNRFRV